MSTKQIFTRVKFCQKCYNKNYPKSGQVFLAYGTTHNCLIAKYATRNGKRGFTPHILILDKVIGGMVKYEALCSICGTKEKGDEYYFLYDDFRKEEISIKEWNAWVLYKGDKDFEI